MDFPPGQTVDGSFARWQATGVTKGRHDGLRGRLRAAKRRPTDPTTGAIDSQSGHGAATVGPDSTGDDAGTKTGG